MTDFQVVKPMDYQDRVIDLMARQWFLLTAGEKESFNTMTCAWGGLGFLWNRPVCFIFVRPQRYTYEFVEKHDNFTISVFTEEHRAALQYCGTHSGRDVDKIAETGLTPVFDEKGWIYFDESRLVIKSRKIYFDDIKEAGFSDPDLLKVYPEHDFHRIYIGQIEEILQKK